MKKFSTLTLTGASTSAKAERGKLELEKGFKAPGLKLKVTVALANTSGGEVTLTDAQKQALFSNFQFDLTYGKNGQHKPYMNVDFRVLHHLQRMSYGSEIEGYSDATTGLAQAISNSATDTMVFYPTIPLGKGWFFHDAPDQLGMGRSQLRTVELSLRRTAAATIVSGVVISGNVTVELIPDQVPCEGDHWTTCPAYLEVDETDKTTKLPPGLPLLIAERTAVHASSALTNISMKFDQQIWHDQVSPAEIVTEFNDVENLPASSLLTDRWTILYMLTGRTPLRNLPTGEVRITQNVKDLATFKAAYFYIPIVENEAVAADVENVATNLRNKTIRASNTRAADYPNRLAPYLGYRLLDTDDKEIERYAGKQASPGAPAFDAIPNGLKAAAKLQATLHSSNNEAKAADDVAKRVASQVPGAVQSARGFAAGNTTPVLGSVRQEVASGVAGGPYGVATRV